MDAGIDRRIEVESSGACPGMHRSPGRAFFTNGRLHEWKASRTEASALGAGRCHGISSDGHAALPSRRHHTDRSRRREPSQMEERSLMIDFRGRGRPPVETDHGGFLTIENTHELANASGEKDRSAAGAVRASPTAVLGCRIEPLDRIPPSRVEVEAMVLGRGLPGIP